MSYIRKLGTPNSNSVPTGVAELGTRIHTSLEAWYGHGINPIDALHLIYQLAIEEWPHFEDELLDERSMALVMVEGYVDWVADHGVDADYEVIATEKIVSYDLATDEGPVTLVAKLDQLVRNTFDGSIWFRDYKTVGTLTKVNDLIRDEQFRFYTMLQTLLWAGTNQQVGGGLYTMLLRSKRTVRATGPFYAQVPIAYNLHDLESMRQRTVAVAEEMLVAERKLADGQSHLKVVYPNPGDHCRWSCPFVSVCHLADDGSRFEAALTGNLVERDPYDYYGNESIDAVVATLKTS